MERIDARSTGTIGIVGKNGRPVKIGRDGALLQAAVAIIGHFESVAHVCRMSYDRVFARTYVHVA